MPNTASEFTTDALLTTSGAARLAGTSESNIRYLAKTGKLPCTRLAYGGLRLFARADIQRLAERRATR
jgi:excisionase family DNA binding protein